MAVAILCVSSLAALFVVQYPILGDSAVQSTILLDEETQPVDTIGQDDDIDKELAPIVEASQPSAPCGMQ